MKWCLSYKVLEWQYFLWPARVFCLHQVIRNSLFLFSLTFFECVCITNTVRVLYFCHIHTRTQKGRETRIASTVWEGVQSTTFSIWLTLEKKSLYVWILDSCKHWSCCLIKDTASGRHQLRMKNCPSSKDENVCKERPAYQVTQNKKKLLKKNILITIANNN